MFFRGAPFQRDAHGGCNLLPIPRLPNISAGLSTPDTIAAIRHIFLRARAGGFQGGPRTLRSNRRDPAPYRITPVGIHSCEGREAGQSTQAPRLRSPQAVSRPQLVVLARQRGLARFTREEVLYVRRLLGNRVRAFDHGGNLTHLRRHRVFQVERIAAVGRLSR
jgi:hypothetical protein